MNLISCSDSVSAGLLTLLMEDWSAAMDWKAVNWTMKAAETTTTFFMMRAGGEMLFTHSRNDGIFLTVIRIPLTRVTLATAEPNHHRVPVPRVSQVDQLQGASIYHDHPAGRIPLRITR